MEKGPEQNAPHIGVAGEGKAGGTAACGRSFSRSSVLPAFSFYAEVEMLTRRLDSGRSLGKVRPLFSCSRGRA